MEKLTDWANEPTVEDLDADYTAAMTNHNYYVGLIEKWQDAIDVKGVYALQPRKGRSSVQPKVIRKHAEWRYPALSEPFLSVKNLFCAEPRTPFEQEKTHQDIAILNYQFNNEIGKTFFIDNLVRSLCDRGVAIIRTGWHNQVTTVVRQVPSFTYDTATPEQQNIILQISERAQNDPATVDKLPTELKESYLYSVEQGIPVWATVAQYNEVSEEVDIADMPTLDVCDFRNVIVDPTCGNDFSRAKFVVYTFESSRDELESAGIYHNIDKIPDDAAVDFTRTHNEDTSFTFSDKTRKKFTAYEYWGYWDIRNDGTTEPIVATWVGDVLIRLELNPYPHKKIPFVAISYLPEHDTIYGKSDPYLLTDTQRVIGALVRGQLDAMARSANGQRGIRKDALDAVNLQKFSNGDDYMFNQGSHPAESIMNHLYPELPQSSFAMLQMHAQEAEALTGTKTFSGGISGDELGSTATGVSGVLSIQSQRELSIIRRISDGLVTVARMILSMNDMWLSDEKIVHITGDAPIRSAAQQSFELYDMELTVSNDQLDAIKASELSFMYQTVGNTLPFDISKLLLAKVMHLRKLPDLEKALLEYEAPPSPLDELEMQIKQAALEKEQLEIQKLQLEIQMLEPAKAQKLANEALLIEQNARKVQAQADNISSGLDHQNQLELIKAQAESNLNRDLVLKMNNLT